MNYVVRVVFDDKFKTKIDKITAKEQEDFFVLYGKDFIYCAFVDADSPEEAVAKLLMAEKINANVLDGLKNKPVIEETINRDVLNESIGVSEVVAETKKRNKK